MIWHSYRPTVPPLSPRWVFGEAMNSSSTLIPSSHGTPPCVQVIASPPPGRDPQSVRPVEDGSAEAVAEADETGVDDEADVDAVDADDGIEVGAADADVAVLHFPVAEAAGSCPPEPVVPQPAESMSAAAIAITDAPSEYRISMPS